MAVFDSLLADFSRRLGLERLTPGGDGVVDLTIENAGRLQVECSGEWLLVTLARPVTPHETATIPALLDAAHWRENQPWIVHPGMKGDEWLTLTARLPLADVDITRLEQVVEWLIRRFDAVEAGR